MVESIIAYSLSASSDRCLKTFSQTVAEFVPPVAGETAGAMISSGGERPSGFWWARPRYQTWPTGCCGLECGDAKAIPVRKLILSRSPAPPPWRLLRQASAAFEVGRYNRRA